MPHNQHNHYGGLAQRCRASVSERCGVTRDCRPGFNPALTLCNRPSNLVGVEGCNPSRRHEHRRAALASDGSSLLAGQRRHM